MADKSFGVKELNLLNASGTPTVTSPNNLNLNANTVAISTSATVGNNLTVSGQINVGSNIKIGNAGVVTATSFVGSGANLTGISAGISTDPSNIQATWKLGGGSGSGFTFTGPGQDGSEGNPDIYLVRGQRYLFDNTALAGNHPFEFRNAANDADYTDGVSGAQNGLQYINVQHDAPAALKYRCTIHTSSMLGNIYIVGQHLANGADNRVLTATSAYGINAESGLTYNGTRLDVTTGDLQVIGGEGGNAEIRIVADQGDEGSDYWRFQSAASNNKLKLASYASGSWVDKVNVDTSGNLEVVGGNLIIGTSGKGIDFSATGGPASGTGGSELLDDYEQGTFSPAWFDDGGSFVSAYSVQYGQYTKIGNVVYFCFGLRIGSFSRTPNSGQFCRVGNLPYVSRVVGDDQEPVFNLYARLWGSGTPPETAWIRQSSGGSGSNHVEFYMDESQTGNDHQLVGADFDTSSTCRVVVNGFYFTTD